MMKWSRYFTDLDPFYDDSLVRLTVLAHRNVVHLMNGVKLPTSR